MIINKRKKKKGFTLIELIAVIAILAILGAILVPKVGGYSARANTSKDLANAKQLLQAIEMYNQDHEAAQIGDSVAAPITIAAISNTNLGTYISWPANPKTYASVAAAAATATTPAVLAANVTVGTTTWEAMTVLNLRGYAAYLETVAK
jgi:prepilin-type N-terminal cleavage/methylation domain-containing protein